MKTAILTHPEVRETVARAIEDGRVMGIDAAIEAANYLGYLDFVPVLTVLRDWPRAGGFRHLQERSMNGTVKRLVTDKGFGFLLGADGVERFFHYSAVKSSGGIDALKEGDRKSVV